MAECYPGNPTTNLGKIESSARFFFLANIPGIKIKKKKNARVFLKKYIIADA